MSQALQRPEDSPSGLTDRIARWARRLSAHDEATVATDDSAPMREGDSRRFSREVERRRSLYDDIGAFLFAHDLDLTPLNFGLAMDYITGNNHAVEQAVKAVLAARGSISNGWIESLAAEQQQDHITPESLAEMLSKVEENLSLVTNLVGESRMNAKDYGAALQEQVRDLSHDADNGPVLAKLITLTRGMVEKTREVEAEMRENQKQTRILQQSLETARKAAEQDHLTGLPNRRAFEARLNAEAVAAEAAQEPLSVAFCDIDHFKHINDAHGHDTGDRVLKFVAGLLAAASDDKCHVARHGGEEFVMLLRGKTAAEACAVVDSVRQDMSERSLVNRSTGERMDQVTFSAGVANVFGYEDPRAALKAADRALYLAKEHGRNRVYMATEAERD